LNKSGYTHNLCEVISGIPLTSLEDEMN
jgi:hypothetical protein